MFQYLNLSKFLLKKIPVDAFKVWFGSKEANIGFLSLKLKLKLKIIDLTVELYFMGNNLKSHFFSNLT